MSTAALDRAADADFVLVTEWHLAAHIDAVWEALNHPDYWPRWWPYVRAVEKLRGGDAEGVGALYLIEWTSKLPYDITFEVETVEVAHYERIRGLARGQLNGQGLWEFFPEESSTRVRYTWSVNLVEPWMRRLKPLAAPIFRWNHNAVMRAGAVGLARHLHTTLVTPAPPEPPEPAAPPEPPSST
jgi:uncharacterized protein YndB with AHSA1/START domain